ncbi:MAG: gephyrin-like molybdotransferase Glp [Candidatus Omnitrophota bacterium]
MISFEKAYSTVISTVRKLGPTELLLSEAAGCVLAEDVRSPLDMPPFDKSAMDGYALRANDAARAPVFLRCVGTVKAGNFSRRVLRKGECFKIMTGSPVPKGADCVVMVENTETTPGGVCFKKSAKKRENICLKGEDIRTGAVVLRKGSVVRPSEVAIAASLGRKSLKVYRRPTVAVLNTGDEITEPGGRLSYGKIYNSNGPMLVSLLSSIDATTTYLGIAKDSKRGLTRAVKKGLTHDIFLISGGVSMGDYDLVPSVLAACGAKEVFHKISMKPGKPVFFGMRKNSYVFGVPGNPVSTFLAFEVFIKPAYDAMMRKKPFLRTVRGVLKDDFKQKPGRKHFVPVAAVCTKDRVEVIPVKGYHGSADIASLSRANAFMIIDGSLSFVKKNTPVDVIMW